jgi:hypothetical protein
MFSKTLKLKPLLKTHLQMKMVPLPRQSPRSQVKFFLAAFT